MAITISRRPIACLERLGAVRRSSSCRSSAGHRLALYEGPFCSTIEPPLDLFFYGLHSLTHLCITITITITIANYTITITITIANDVEAPYGSAYRASYRGVCAN